jgi:hypothetical protein
MGRENQSNVGSVGEKPRPVQSPGGGRKAQAMAEGGGSRSERRGGLAPEGYWTSRASSPAAGLVRQSTVPSVR